MFKPLARLVVSPGAIVLLDLLIVIPMSLAIYEVARGLGHHETLHDALEIVTGIGVLMIGWGVVLEERATLREVFGIEHSPDQKRQKHLDQMCHHFGLGQLILGLLAEICVEMVHLPDKIINTSGIEAPVIGLGLIFIAVGGLFLIVHIFRIIVLAFK